MTRHTGFLLPSLGKSHSKSQRGQTSGDTQLCQATVEAGQVFSERGDISAERLSLIGRRHRCLPGDPGSLLPAQVGCTLAA